ncbi:PREDICTED: KH domain-containing protein HEN4 [Tarenaya hassleriana]|uniref:KH domain-containing protein HEN4 n=1 Tax=Tarenaya hassleriana TaxID=28532 RepID=UPI00053C4DA9|nr:PREDICTED: KH domain-containing protein HEN4 [Tarenaya hassleriana]
MHPQLHRILPNFARILSENYLVPATKHPHLISVHGVCYSRFSACSLLKTPIPQGGLPVESHPDNQDAASAMQNRRPSAAKRQSRKIPVIHVLPGQVALRVVCHSSVVGGIIGLNGAVVSQIRRDTGSRIHCHQPDNGSEHWVIFIVGSTSIDNRIVLTDRVGSTVDCDEGERVECEVSTAQAALIRVSERLWAVLAEKDHGGGAEEGAAYCGILADSTQIGAVLGKGGKNVEWMRKETGARITVLPPPACGTKRDQLIQVTGRVLAVKKALIMVSGCLQDCPPLDGYPPPLCSKPFETVVDGKSEDPHSEFFPHLSSLLPPVTANNAVEAASKGDLSSTEVEWTSYSDAKDSGQDVVFKIICTYVAAGGIIGKSGSVLRALQNGTGASITLGAPLAVSGDRIVTISAHENLDSWHSPAQNALILVFTKSVEIDTGNGRLTRGLGDGAIVKAKLLVPSDFANSVNENRDIIEVTGADIHVLGEDQILGCTSENEVVIEIVGEYKDVRKTLSQVTSMLRNNLSPKDVLNEQGVGHTYNSPDNNIQAHEMDSHTLNLQQSQNPGRGCLPSVSDDPKMIWSGTELNKSLDCLFPFEVGNEMGQRSTDGELKNTASSGLQENDLSQGMKDLELSSNNEISSSPTDSSIRKPSVSLKSVTMEIAVREDALATLYGRDGCGLSNLQQVSGVRVEVQDPEGGEGTIVISGSPGQIREAMGLIVSIVADQ